LNAIAVTGPNRSRALPDVPTVAETLPGFEVTVWYGLLAPVGTPKEIVQRNAAEILRVLRAPELQQLLTSEGVDVSGMGPEPFQAFIKNEYARWGKVVKESGAKLD
jgi:tripartite-type tricarboxylate transporter receptor subunit TctC